MSELQKHLDETFKLISTLPVSGDGVEIMAAAKEHLRAAYQLVVNGESVEEDG